MARLPHGQVVTTGRLQIARSTLAEREALVLKETRVSRRRSRWTCTLSTTCSRFAERSREPAGGVARHGQRPEAAVLHDGGSEPAGWGERLPDPGGLHLFWPVRRPRHHPGGPTGRPAPVGLGFGERSAGRRHVPAAGGSDRRRSCATSAPARWTWTVCTTPRPPGPEQRRQDAHRHRVAVVRHGRAVARPRPRATTTTCLVQPRSSDILHDRAAMIGDPRNDENLIVSQLHLAFLKAHNQLVDQGKSFEEARRILRQHYQHIIVHDFLKRVADPTIVENILAQGTPFYNATEDPFFVPLEFAVAGFRFGHTMVRAAYNFNTNFNFADGRPATLELLFTFTALSGQLGFGAGTDTLPENWIIQWENIIGDGPAVGKARRFDPQLAALVNGETKALFGLRALDGNLEGGLAARLAARNLLRGYRLRLPTGQAVAGRLGLRRAHPRRDPGGGTGPDPGPGCRRVRRSHPVVVLPAGRGQAPRRAAARAGGQHDRRWGPHQPHPPQRGLDSGGRLHAVAAGGHGGHLRTGRPAALRPRLALSQVAVPTRCCIRLARPDRAPTRRQRGHRSTTTEVSHATTHPAPEV